MEDTTTEVAKRLKRQAPYNKRAAEEAAASVDAPAGAGESESDASAGDALPASVQPASTDDIDPRDTELDETHSEDGTETVNAVNAVGPAVGRQLVLSNGAALIPTETLISCGLDTGMFSDSTVFSLFECCRYNLGLFTIGTRPDFFDSDGRYHPSEPRLERKWRTMYYLRHLEIFPLETSYHDIAERCADILESLEIAQTIRRVVTVEINYGSGVDEILRETFKKRPSVGNVTLNPVMTTAGSQDYVFGSRTCSKLYMVNRLIRLMSAEVPELIIPSDLANLVPALTELRDFQSKVKAETGNTSYNARPGAHDDITMAMALGTILRPEAFEVRYSPRIY